MAPELFETSKGKSGLSTRESDIFALGMVTFEVRNAYLVESFAVLKYHLVPYLRYSPDNCRFPRIRSGGP